MGAQGEWGALGDGLAGPDQGCGRDHCSSNMAPCQERRVHSTNVRGVRGRGIDSGYSLETGEGIGGVWWWWWWWWLGEVTALHFSEPAAS